MRATLTLFPLRLLTDYVAHYPSVCFNMVELRRVVVTGLGAVNPLGCTVADSWQALLHKTSGLCSLKEALENQNLSEESIEHELKLSSDLPCQVAAAVRGSMQKRENRSSRNVEFALLAGHEAMCHSGLHEWLPSQREECNRKHEIDRRIGVSMGCGMTSLRDISNSYYTLMNAGYRKISPHFVPKSLTNAASGRLSIEYGLQGPNCTASTACAAGSHAIGDAFRLIQQNAADVMLAGGSEACIEPVGIAGFCRLRALSTAYNDDPVKASRPFDAQRDGFVMGEGAAVLVLEEMEHAKARGAPLLAEVTGYGLAGDGHHITAPDPYGKGAEYAMRMALGFDETMGARVDYVNAHATSTPVGDEIEANVIDRVLYETTKRETGTHAFVSSTKGSTGHLLGAAGAIESIFAIQAIVDQKIPPTLNLETIQEKTRFQHVESTLTNQEVNVAMNNSFGFGGTNASLVFERIHE